MSKSKWVASFVFSTLILLSPSFRPEPALAETPGPDASETRRITVDTSNTSDTSGNQAVSIQQAIDKAVPSAVPVQQAVPGDTAPVAAKPSAAPKQVEKPAEAKAPDAPKSAVKPAPADGQAVKVVPSLPEAKPSPANFLKAGDTTLLPNGKPATVQLPPATPASEAEDIMKVKPVSSDLFSPIEKNIGYFSSTIKKHFTRYLSRSGKYIEMMKSILRENYLPEDLVFLALIESGFNTKAYSVAKASGPWQFIKGTATRYGLRVDRWVDERRDPIKSTQAAAAYLKDLYEMFGSWPLAMASYNCGEGNIARAVRRNDTQDFWELRKTRSIPSETKDYVPKFVAAQMIASNPEKYGFNDVEYDRPFEFEEVKLNQCTSLATAAKCCEVPEAEIKDLNPELLRSCTPPNRTEYTLRVPKGTKEIFLKNYAALSDEEKVTTPPKVPSSKRYMVRRGDTLKSIARKFDISITRLAKANGLRSTSKVRRGRRLNIPVDDGIVVASGNAGGKKKKAKAETAPAAENAEAAASDSQDTSVEAKPSARAKAASYKVRKGDTLFKIARSNGMSVAELARLNGLKVKSRVKIGQRLALVKAGGGEKVAGTRAVSKKTAAKKSGKKYASKKTYKVRRGDTLYSIARKFNISKEKLAQANSISGSSIRRGQRLVIPADEEAA